MPSTVVLLDDDSGLAHAGGELEAVQWAKLLDRILDVLADTDSEALTLDEVREEAKAGKARVTAVINRLVESGQVFVHGRGVRYDAKRYTRVRSPESADAVPQAAE